MRKSAAMNEGATTVALGERWSRRVQYTTVPTAGRKKWTGVDIK